MNRARNTTITALTLLLTSGCASLNSPSTSPNRQHEPAADALPGLTAYEAPAAGLAANTPEHVRHTASTAEDSDFWHQVRSGFRLPGKQHAAVKKQIVLYSKSTRHVARIITRGEPYLAYIQGEVEKRGFPSEITLLPFVESGYDPFAYSHGRAAGLWQFIPGTGKRYGLKQDWWYDGRRDVIASTEAALNYLDKLQQKFNGDWLLALAAYNAGEGTVRRAVSNNRQAGKPVDFWHLDLPRETSSYVPKLLAISTILERPQRYGVTLAPIDTTPSFTVVGIHNQLDLGIAAELAGIELEELYRLNPGFNRWATHPDGPHRLAIPVAKSSAFEQNLAGLPADKRTKWVRHRVRSGETLSHIARRYDTTVEMLLNINDLHSSSIRSGGHLVIPVSAHDPSRYAALDRIRHASRASGRKLSYQVKSGDNLWLIARNHKVSIKQIAKWNSLASDALIKPGQKLVIWGKGGSSGADGRLRSVHYTVRRGDSLFRISQKFNVSINQLRQWNGLAKDKHLQPGQKLKLYVDITRQS